MYCTRVNVMCEYSIQLYVVRGCYLFFSSFIIIFIFWLVTRCCYGRNRTEMLYNFTVHCALSASLEHTMCIHDKNYVSLRDFDFFGNNKKKIVFFGGLLSRLQQLAVASVYLTKTLTEMQ